MRVALVAPSRSDPAHRRVLGALAREHAAAGDTVFSFPPRDGLPPEALARGLERLLRTEAAEVCHVQYFSRGLGWLGRVRFPRRTRLVLTHQGAALELMERPDVFRRLARRADSLTCVSRAGVRELGAVFPGPGGRACYVPNGVDFVRPGPAGRAPRRRFILSVGRLAAYKGTDLLLMAFAGLAREARGLDLVVCGPDQTGGRLAAFARRLGLGGRVKLPGDTEPSGVRRLLEDCLFFALPSRRENLPMALLEAMAAGKAVVASAVGGVDELVEDGVDGLLVGPEDAEGLERAMRALTGDAALRRRLGRAAARRARGFEWSAVAAGYRGLYARALSGRSRGDAAQERQVGL